MYLDSSTASMLELHKALIEIESITGNEANVTQWLATFLESHNFTVEKQLVEPPTATHGARENVFAYLGKQRNVRTLLSSHVDVVPPYWPYERRGNEIWGRGSVDAKACIATQFTALEALINEDKVKEGDVGLLFVVDEEDSGIGMKKANDLGLKLETVIFGEPTELKLASGHKGLQILTISAHGRAGHSGYPELGKSANHMLIPALHALQQVEFPSSEKFGKTTVNIGRIEGGVAGNVIAVHASADLTIRIAAGSPAVIQKMVLDVIQQTGEELEVHFGSCYPPAHIDSDVEGFESIVVNYGTDIPNLRGDHKRYLYGTGSILVAHSDHEHLTISDLKTAVQGYKTLIEHSLK